MTDRPSAVRPRFRKIQGEIYYEDEEMPRLKKVILITKNI